MTDHGIGAEPAAAVPRQPLDSTQDGSTRIGPLTVGQTVFALIAITFALRLIGAGSIGWGTGEAYYLATARQLHLSYFDQPPLFLWLIWATTHLTGSESTLVVRLPFVLMFAVSTWLIFDTTRRVSSPLAGFYAALITNASILFSASIGSWIQPDAPMVLFWLATVRVLVEILFGDGARRPYLYWGLAGLFLGLDFLSKYHGFFVALGTGLFLIVNRDQRRWMVHPAPWLALLIAAVLFVPVIIWNAQNDWVSFGFQGDRALVSELRWDRLLRMIIGQIVYMTPWLAIPALLLGVRALFAGPRGVYPPGTTPGAAMFLACFGWPAVIFFTVVALWSDTQYHFHWQAPGYMMLFMLMGEWVARRDGWAVRLWLYGSGLVTVLLLTAVFSHAATGWARNVFPGNWDDPTAQQLPWTELGQALDSQGAFQKSNTFVAGDYWIDCGYIDTQVAGRLPFACLGTEARNLAFNFDENAHVGWNAYLVLKATEAPDWLKARFASIRHVASVTVSRGGRVEISGIELFYAEGFTGAGH